MITLSLTNFLLGLLVVCLIEAILLAELFIED